MECRLCLSFTSVESTISIHDDLYPVVQRIWTCCQLQVKKDDGLPDRICLLCDNNLELLSSFRSVCLQSDEMSKPKLSERMYFKTEDFKLGDESGVNTPATVCTSVDNDVLNKWKSNFERSDFRQNAYLVENVNSQTHSGKVTLCNHKENGINDIEIQLEDPTLLKTSNKISSTRLESDLKIEINVTLNKCEDWTSIKCEICSKLFAHNYKLTKHMRNCHKTVKLYKCDICLKLFTYKSSLAEHEISHTGEKPHKCDMCLKSFSRKSDLVRHERFHTGEKPYKCDICLKSFTQNSNLVSHMKSHTVSKPHKCDICLKTFTKKSSLNTHMKSHAKVKPHKCDICSKSFIYKSTLVEHERSHTGEKPYKCDICLKSCCRKSVLVKHLRSHAGEKLC